MSAAAMLDMVMVSIAAATSFVAQAAAALAKLLTLVGEYIRCFTPESVNTLLFGCLLAPVHSGRLLEQPHATSLQQKLRWGLSSHLSVSSQCLLLVPGMLFWYSVSLQPWSFGMFEYFLSALF